MVMDNSLEKISLPQNPLGTHVTACLRIFSLTMGTYRFYTQKETGWTYHSFAPETVTIAPNP